METLAIGIKVMANRIEPLVGKMIPRIFACQFKQFIHQVGAGKQGRAGIEAKWPQLHLSQFTTGGGCCF